MSIKKKLFHGFFWSFSDNIINKLGMFIISIYLANQLGPSAFGLIGMLTIFILLSDSLIDSGFSQALVQRSHRVTESELSTVFIVNITLSIFIYVILYCVSPYIAQFYNQPELESISKILFLVIVINSFSVVARAKLIINIDFKSITKANFLANIFGGGIAFLFLHKDYGYWSLVAMTLTKSFIVTTSLLFYGKWTPKLMFCKEDFNKLFSFGSRLLIAGLVATGINNLCTILIGRYFNTQQVGYYTQSANLTNTLSGVILSVLQGVTYPIMTEISNDREKLIYIYSRLLKITMIVTFPVMFGFITIAGTFTKLFLGNEWLPIVPIIISLSLARVITPISSVNMNILNAIGRSDLFLKVDISKLPITLLSVFIGIPFGILGIAIANVTTTFIFFFINTYYPGKLFGFGALKQIKLAFKPLLSAIIMVFIIYFIKLDNLWLELIMKITIGFTIYLLSLYLLKDDDLCFLSNKLLSKLKIK